MSEFTGTVDGALLSKDIHDTFFGIEPPTTVSVVLDITPDGLVKRIKLTGVSGGLEFYMVGEVLSISTPVAVDRPSVRDTISATRLTQTELRALDP